MAQERMLTRLYDSDGETLRDWELEGRIVHLLYAVKLRGYKGLDKIY